MGLLDRFRPRAKAAAASSPQSAPLPPRPAQPQLPSPPLWSPGDVRLEVKGSHYRSEAVARVNDLASTGATLAGVLIPEPSNAHDPNAVAIHVAGHHVGYVSARLAPLVQPALISRLRRNGGQLSGRLEIKGRGPGTELDLFIDPAPLGLKAEQLDTSAAMNRQVKDLLGAFFPMPPAVGVDTQGRVQLARLQKRRETLESEFGRSASDWIPLETAFGALARRLDRAQDAAAGAAWLGLARSLRYQTGRRADTLVAYAESLRRDPSLVDAWEELLTYLAWAPDVSTLMQVFHAAPARVRPQLLRTLLAISRGYDRARHMTEGQGADLRATLISTAKASAAHDCLAVLYAEAGTHAKRTDNMDEALLWWRLAVANGCTEPGIVNQVSIVLVKERDLGGAAQALRASLAREDVSRTSRTAMENRLARCERELADGSR